MTTATRKQVSTETGFRAGAKGLLAALTPLGGVSPVRSPRPILSHLLLDMLLPSYGIPLFWPSLLHLSTTHIGYFDPATPSFLHGSLEALRRSSKMMILDMSLGTAWIFYLWWKKKIRF